MPSYHATALVLRKTKLGEADTIVTMLGSEGIQIRAVAKGVRRTKSKIGARLEPFAVVDLLLHAGRNLDVVREVSTVASHERVRADFDRTTAAAVVADLLDRATADADAEPVLYELALATLDACEEVAPSALPWLVAAFLLKALSLLGFRPTLTSCARCACESATPSSFSVEHGGAVCAACAEIDSDATRLSVGARDALATLLRARMADVGSIEASTSVRDEVLYLLRRFAGYHIHARLRSLEFLFGQLDAGTWPSVDPPAAVG
jgi:DNA repair protein RecO (recombination protein O)